jgi:alpha-glucosidase
VLSNHDNLRHRSRYGTEARARAAAVMLLTLRGTPFLYAGEELGLEDADVPPEREVDPGGRDGCRAPIPWTATAHHGWASDDPWLPWPPDAAARNAESLRADPDSILHLYRRLLAARRASPALSAGDFAFVDAPDGVLAYSRSEGTDTRAVVINFAPSHATIALADSWQIEVASDGRGEGFPFTGAIGADVGLLLRPT